MGYVLVPILVVCFVVLAVLAERFGKRIGVGKADLKPFYRRLGEVAPGALCPCRANTGVKLYSECCRPRDVKLLDDEVRNFLWTRWMRRSGGRQRARSMKDRLEDFPMSTVKLPEWVNDPERFAFPIDEETLRAWTPEDAVSDALLGAEDSDSIPI